MFLVIAALLISCTLLVDLVFREMAHPWLLWSLLGCCLAGGAAALALGTAVPRWIGLVAVVIFIASHTYFLGLPDDPQTAVSSVQQLPIVALYLGWFVRPRLAILLIAACAALFGAAMARNPLFAAEGTLGSPVAVHGILILLFCFFAGTYLWRRAYRRATLDPLTGAVNRQGLADRIESRIRRRAVDRAPCSLVAVDFDDFKLLNDTLGHAAGDAALIGAVAAWRTAVRPRDVIGRVGGDEFALLLPRTDAAEAACVVSRLQAVSEHSWSWGIAEVRAGDSADALMARADRELFARKRARRGVADA